MVSRVIQVVNPTGLHLRPAGIVCQASMKFKSRIMILHKNKEINAKSVLNMMTCGIKFNAKSVLNMMTCGIKCGEEIEIQCTGEDEAEALEAVCNVIATGLEDY